MSVTEQSTGGLQKFEGELEAELIRQEQAERVRFDYSWLNAPFTLWVLSTLAIGGLSFWYSSYSANYSACRTDNRQVAKLFYELYDRRAKISTLSHIGANIGDLKSAIRILDAEQTYTFTEFKGKKLVELVFDLNAIVDRRNLLSDDERASNDGRAPSRRRALRQSKVRAIQENSPSPPDFSLKDRYWTLAFLRFSGSTAINPPEGILADGKAALEIADSGKVSELLQRTRTLATEFNDQQDFTYFVRKSGSEFITQCWMRALWPV
jgi:hypothetical protein